MLIGVITLGSVTSLHYLFIPPYSLSGQHLLLISWTLWIVGSLGGLTYNAGHIAPALYLIITVTMSHHDRWSALEKRLDGGCIDSMEGTYRSKG